MAEGQGEDVMAVFKVRDFSYRYVRGYFICNFEIQRNAQLKQINLETGTSIFPGDIPVME